MNLDEAQRQIGIHEMMRAVGAKAVASVEMAVPPTMVAGELSVESSEGETSGEDFRDGDHSDIDD